MGIASGSTSESEFPECLVSEGGKLIVNTNRGPYTLEPSSLGLKILHVERNWYDQVIGELSRELVWLRWNDIGHSNLQSLKSLKNLRVLQLYEYSSNGKQRLKELWKTDENAPLQLRELVIEDCSEFQGFPKSIGSLKHLKKIVLSDASKLRSLPEEFCLLQSLEHLRLTSTELLSLPNSFGHLRNLRHLDLSSNRRLGRLPVSFKELRFLQHLNMESCCEVTLESDILEKKMKLQYLNFDYCGQLEGLPCHITNQPSLRELYCVIKRVMEVPVSIDQLRKLQRIFIGGDLLTSLPTSMGDLSSLTFLTISYCAKLQCLPDSLGCLNLLMYLEITSSGVHSLPKSVGQLVNLQTLVIRSCPMSELDLRVSQLTALKDIAKVSNISISGDSLPVLITLSLYNNTNLTHIECLPNSLRKIRLVGNPKLEALPSFAQTAFLREFELKGCNRVKKIHGLEHCTALETLKADTCWEEAGIESLERMERLRRVEVKTESRSGVEGCIQSIKKWPGEEMIVCAQAAPDLELSLVKSCIVFANLCVVDSFTEQEMDSKPALKLPGSTGGCILLCYVFNCESPQTSLRATRGESHFRTLELGKGKWVWTGLFTQHSDISRWVEMDQNRRSFSCIKIGEASGMIVTGEASGMIVTGEEERLQQAFSHIWAFR